MSTENRQVAGPPLPIRLAGALVGVEGVVGLGVAVALGVSALSAGSVNGNVLGEAGYFLLMGVALVAVGVGLYVGGRWARTPAIVTQLLLLPVVYSLLGGSQQLLLGVVTGAFVLTTFLLLISERSRVWWMGIDESEPPAQP